MGRKNVFTEWETHWVRKGDVNEKVREAGRGQNQQDLLLNPSYIPLEYNIWPSPHHPPTPPHTHLLHTHILVSSFLCCIILKSFCSNPGRQGHYAFLEGRNLCPGRWGDWSVGPPSQQAAMPVANPRSSKPTPCSYRFAVLPLLKMSHPPGKLWGWGLRKSSLYWDILVKNSERTCLKERLEHTPWG